MGPLVLAFAGLLFWHLLCTLLRLPRYLLPKPGDIVSEIGVDGFGLLSDSVVTALEAVAGFIVANIASLLLAIAMVQLRWLERSLYPWLIALKSTPVVALAPISIIWLGYGPSSKILLSAIVAFFPLVVTATAGLRVTPQEALDLCRSWGTPPLQVLFRVRFPYAVPYLVSGLRISASMAVVGAVIAEMSGGERGLGVRLLISMYQTNTPAVFATAFASSLIGMLMFGSIGVLELCLRRFIDGTEVLE